MYIYIYAYIYICVYIYIYIYIFIYIYIYISGQLWPYLSVAPLKPRDVLLVRLEQMDAVETCFLNSYFAHTILLCIG